LGEILLAGAVFMGLVQPVQGQSLWVYEESHRTIHFDPVSGKRVMPIGARWARITKGTVEYVGLLKGNNEGFSDRDDFAVKRSQSKKRRFAVFGDSFSTAQYIQKNWPDFVEDTTRAREPPLELLNFAIDGGGLANWWSILTKIVERERYEIDGVIFAVLDGDLYRGFYVEEHHGTSRPLSARIPTWDPRFFPKTLKEARPYLYELDGYIVSAAKFDAALCGKWTPKRLPLAGIAWGRFARRWEKIVDRLRAGLTKTAEDHLRAGLTETARVALIQDMRRSLNSLKVPVLVVSVPHREELLRDGDSIQVPAATRQFAELLRAKLVNGGRAFQGLTAAAIRADWLPYDGHWGQGGSDRFGRFMADILRE
jgi:hypothetical protein